MLIRKNTKQFKAIVEIITACQSRPDREKLVRLYITKAGHTIEDRINIEGIQGDSEVFYELNYQTVLTYLNSPNHQLHESDDIPGIYFFRSSSNKLWDEAPFEFDDAVKNEFSSLPELPVTRKKGKTEKFVLPVSSTKTEPKKKSGSKQTKPKIEIKPLKVADDEPRQPNYKLKHKFQFTDLEKIVFRQPKMNKKDVLDYYNKVAANMLPFLKDRMVTTRGSNGTTTLEEMVEDNLHTRHDWLQMASVPGNKSRKEIYLCNDGDHLLLYAELGCLEFDSGISKTKSFDSPDFMVIGLDSRDPELTKVKEVALAAKEILSGLQLPSFVKTDGMSALHIYVPLDSKSKFETSRKAAEFICRLIRIKVPAITAMEGDDDDYGKVYLHFSVNEKGKTLVVPYSLLPGQSAIVATPLQWSEINKKLRPEEFTPEIILQRLKRPGDPFEDIFRKKIDVKSLLERLEENYSFLL
jgi:bifunctional non-homologous end joining protein LigD